MSTLWVPLALSAGLFQSVRNGLARSLSGAISPALNSWSRFAFNLPFSTLLFTALVVADGFPAVSPRYYLLCLATGITQLLGNVCLVAAFRHTSFAQAIVFHKLATGAFWDLVVLHAAVFTGLGLFYGLRSRSWPAAERVGPLSYLAAMAVMPVTYLVLTPLALFTLDSESWETRGAPSRRAPQPPPAAVSAASLAPAEPAIPPDALPSGRGAA